MQRDKEEMLTTAYLRSRESFKNLQRMGKKEELVAQRHIMTAAKQKADVHIRTCKLCSSSSSRVKLVLVDPE
jgi:hypothetical protein